MLQCVACLQSDAVISSYSDAFDCFMLQYVAVCCSVLQRSHHALMPPSHFTMCCSVLQCVVVCCSMLHCVAVCCRHLITLRCLRAITLCVAVCCSELYCAAIISRNSVRCSVLQCFAVCCSVLQCVAVILSNSDASKPSSS